MTFKFGLSFLISASVIVAAAGAQEGALTSDRILDVITRSYPPGKQGILPPADLSSISCKFSLPDSLAIVRDSVNRRMLRVSSWRRSPVSGDAKWEDVMLLPARFSDTLRAQVVGARCELLSSEILLRVGQFVIGLSTSEFVKPNDYDIANPRRAAVYVLRSGRLIPAVADQESTLSPPTQVVDVETYLAQKGTLGGRLGPSGDRGGNAERMLDRILEDYPRSRVGVMPTTERRYEQKCPKIPFPDSIALVADDDRQFISLSSWQNPLFGRDTSEWRSVLLGLRDRGATPDTLRAKAVGVMCELGSAQLILQVDSVLVGLSLSSLLHAYGWDQPIHSTEPAAFAIREGRLIAALYQEAIGAESAPTRVTDIETFHKEAAERTAAARAERARRIRAKGWSPSITNAVLAGKVSIGMTAEMVRLSWGQPYRVNQTITAAGTDEQWVYDGQYVSLRNGVVRAIQTSR